MAGGGTCALLLRAATLGGLTAAAWLITGAVANADTEPVATPPVTEAHAELLSNPAGWATSLTIKILQPDEKDRGVEPGKKPKDEPADEGPVLDFTGGTSSGSERSGQVSNQAPAHVIAAKAEIRAAKRAARLAAAATPAPEPPPAPPAPQKIVQAPPAPIAPPVAEQPIETDADWTVPQPSHPLPAQQPAPACTAPSVSSGHHDNSGGARGVLAVLPSHSAMFPPTTWTVEERTDGRSPGSLPGLPSTSPD